MIQQTIQKIEARLQDRNLSSAEHQELLDLLAQLKEEIDTLAGRNPDGAQTVAGFTNISAHQALRSPRNPELLDLSLKGLSRSVEEFEKSHPKLVAVVNRISTILANMGI
jgi:hypothetical protein